MFTPVWGCGLKSVQTIPHYHTGNVHPRVGVWIEIRAETLRGGACSFTPVWGCGLKYGYAAGIFSESCSVHPRVGVWIEIRYALAETPAVLCSPPCGGVD